MRKPLEELQPQYCYIIFMTEMGNIKLKLPYDTLQDSCCPRNHKTENLAIYHSKCRDSF